MRSLWDREKLITFSEFITLTKQALKSVDCKTPLLTVCCVRIVASVFTIQNFTGFGFLTGFIAFLFGFFPQQKKKLLKSKNVFRVSSKDSSIKISQNHQIIKL